MNTIIKGAAAALVLLGSALLGPDGTLEAGYEGTVTIGDGSDQCLYDFRFETGEGALLEVAEVNICELNSYTLTD